MALLPDDFDGLLRDAVKVFWQSRATGSTAQGGTRGQVISGKNLDGFIGVVEAVADHCGIPSSSVITKGRGALTIPGYFRPTKRWDALVVYEHRLLAVLEFKSHVGSFGNNANNRAEEAIGLAKDLQLAVRDGLYQPGRHVKNEAATVEGDPRPPFGGYLVLLQDSEDSTRPIGVDEPHYPVDPVFKNASYTKRYKILCERLMAEGLYGAASVMVSPEDDHGLEGHWQPVSEATDPRYLFGQLAATLTAAREEAEHRG